MSQLPPSPQALALQVKDPRGNLIDRHVVGDQVVLGRSADAHVHLQDATVSRRHAEIVHDPFHRWWVRDLGSRNGTYLNGRPVDCHPLAAGDVLAIGKFSVRVISLGFPSGSGDAVAQRPPSSGGRSTDTLRITQTGSALAQSLPDLEPPRIAARHLDLLQEFAQRLLRLATADQRLAELCRLMVRDDMHARSAMVVRIDRAAVAGAAASAQASAQASAPDAPPPEILAGPESCPAWAGRRAQLSPTLLASLAARQEPWLVCFPGGGGAAARNAAAAAPEPLADSAEIGCPLDADDRSVTALCAVLPARYGTAEWLALAQLAVKQFQHCELMLRNQVLVPLEHDLLNALHVQLSTLPRGVAVPGLDVSFGFKPCKYVAGDYVDIVRLPDGRRALLAVGDVCGKGLPAALVASALRTAIHIGVRTGHCADLPDFIAQLNGHLRESLPSNCFVTLLAMLVDPATGEIRYVNAGHPPPLTVDRAGRVRCLRTEPDPALGIVESRFTPRADRLAPGQLLALYSDGVLAAPAVGEDRLRHLLADLYAAAPDDLPAARLADRLTESLDRLAGATLPTDDRTFLLARLSPA